MSLGKAADERGKLAHQAVRMWSATSALLLAALCGAAHDARFFDARNQSLRALTLTPSLEWVDASDNDIASINATSDALLLRTLTLRNNKLHVLPALGAPRLAALDVSGNALRVLPARIAFPALRTLNLSRNALTTLPPQLLADAPRISSFDASRNSLSSLPVLGLKRRRITHLLLAHNRLVRVDNALLDATHISRELNLAHNALRRFPSAALRKAAFLASVNVADNRIRRLTQGDLDDVLVVSLDISGQLEHVDEGAFREMPLLVNLTLTRSPRLRYLPAGAFDALPALRQVNLSSNGLLAFEQPSFWRHVSLDATHNAFVCHCVHIWLNVSCVNADVSCAPLVLPLLPEEVSVALGTDVDLHCVALGAEKVHWLRVDSTVASNSSQLHVYHAHRFDAGLFTCEALSAMGAARRNVALSVQDPNVRMFAISITSSFVTLAWNMSGALPYVLRWGEQTGESLRSASPPFPPAPRAHSYTVHGLQPLTAYCFALSLEADVTLDRVCVTTRGDTAVGVRRSYAAVVVLGLAIFAALSACVTLCVVSARPSPSTLRRVELIEASDAAFVIELD